VKLPWWSGDGLNLYGKRLERGRLVWPQAANGAVYLTSAQLAMLLEGIDWRRPARTWQPTMRRSNSTERGKARRACIAAAAQVHFRAMAVVLDQLPDDVPTPKRLPLERDAQADADVAEHRVKLETQRGELELTCAKVLTARLAIEKLKLEIARLRRMQFGRRSERRDERVVQLDVLVEELETSLAGLAPEAAAAAAASEPREVPVRRPPPWQALTGYCDDGTHEIDNNAAERALRGPVLSRQNFLFAGADSGGERPAVLYTLLATARLNGVDPEAYLRHVLERIAAYPSNRLSELLPWRHAAQLDGDERLAA
jgi:hypothetical protein